MSLCKYLVANLKENKRETKINTMRNKQVVMELDSLLLHAVFHVVPENQWWYTGTKEMQRAK